MSYKLHRRRVGDVGERNVVKYESLAAEKRVLPVRWDSGTAWLLVRTSLPHSEFHLVPAYKARRHRFTPGHPRNALHI